MDRALIEREGSGSEEQALLVEATDGSSPSETRNATLKHGRNRHVRVGTHLSSRPKRKDLSPSTLRLYSFRNTMRALQLDNSKSSWGFVSWSVAFVLLLVVPIFRLCYFRAADVHPEHQLIFQPLVVIVGILMSAVSFLFLNQAIRKYGLRGILFLDTVAEEAVEIRREYHSAIEQGITVLAKLFFPALVLYILQTAWFYSHIPLAPLPFHISNPIWNLVIIIGSSTWSWIYQTTTFLYACVLFWKICTLQGLRMKEFKDSLSKEFDPERYFHKYIKIMSGLQLTSRRYRLFLAITGLATVFAALASMYEIIAARRSGLVILMAGELLVLNVVNMTGVGLCLVSASKLAHLHRKIIKAACSMHALGTFSSVKPDVLTPGVELSTELIQRLEIFHTDQDAWCRRNALVSFLSSSNVGISVYGFVLDRFLIHTSIGALLTTTWFILGRSLGA